MILQALYDYAQRKEGLAPEGLEYKEIPFVIIIDKTGHFVALHDLRDSPDKKTKAPSFLVTKNNGRARVACPNILWDNFEYVLGIKKEILELAALKAKEAAGELTEEESAKLSAIKKLEEKAVMKRNLFAQKTQQLSEKYPDSTELHAVAEFYRNHNYEDVFNCESWPEFSKKCTENLSFRLEGTSTIVASNHVLLDAAQSNRQTNEQSDKESDDKDMEGICLIRGTRGKIISTTTATSIPGSQAMAKLVSFQVNMGFDSYGKKQCTNAPISPEAEAAYTTSLKYLTGKGSRNKFSLANRTYVFWRIPSAETANEDSLFEQQFAAFFEMETKDNPDRNIEAVSNMFKSIHNGMLNIEGNDMFYILGLAPNAARLSVQYWQKGTIREFARNIKQHFDDLCIVHSKLDREYFSLMSLVLSVTALYKIDNITPNLPDAVLRSILNGTPYSTSLQQACIRRIMADQSVTYKRAAILKAVINRKQRFTNNTEKTINMSLDQENCNQAYLCGRLFATIEKLQEEANGSSSLATDYLTSASTSPNSVFPRLLSLSAHHEAKLDNHGRAIYFNKLKGEIISKIDPQGMPARLMLDDQSRFMIGYYQQRQDFFTTKVNKENEQ